MVHDQFKSNGTIFIINPQDNCHKTINKKKLGLNYSDVLSTPLLPYSYFGTNYTDITNVREGMRTSFSLHRKLSAFRILACHKN